MFCPCLPSVSWRSWRFAIRPLLRPYIAGVLWSDATEGHAAGNLRCALWRLTHCGARLLEADGAMLRLLRVDPFAGRRPTFVRARYYRYQYTNWNERRKTGAWWKRTELGEYLPGVSLEDVR